MGGGSNSGSNSSRPLTGPERAQAFNYGISSVQGGLSQLPYAQYTETAPRTLSGGDYDRLEQSIVESRTAPILRQYTLAKDRLNEDLASRGIWSSGLATRAEGDLYERTLPVLSAASGEAAAQRYGLQAQELGRTDAMRGEEASKAYDSKWRPLDYLAGIYNNTGGAISSSKSSGWNFNI